MANPFASWTTARVDEHNARVAGTHAPISKPVSVGIVTSKVTISQANIQIVKKKPLLNRLEMAWKAELEKRGHKNIVSQGITLRLGEDCRYTVDFFTFEEIDYNFRITAWECKGPHAWDDSIVKLKTAAHQFPFILFVLVKRDPKTKQWFEKVIGV